jgi:hypothetical protein
MLISGQRHMNTVLAEYARHYNGRRPHRGRELSLPAPDYPRCRPLDGADQMPGRPRRPHQRIRASGLKSPAQNR